MGKKIIKLSFVNNGKEFEVPHITVKRQEDILEFMAKNEKNNMSNDKMNVELNKYVVLTLLQDIDSSVTRENIENMHPDDYIYLFNLIMASGRELTGDDDKDFQKND